MLPLGATVITLAFLAGVVELQPVINSVPVQELPLPNVASALQLPPSVPVPNPSSQPDRHPKGNPAGGAGVKCPVMASYRLSAEKLQEYLNGTMPQKIEEMVQCSEVNLAGVLGSVLNTATGLDILGMLPLDTITNLEILDNVLGKGDAAKPKDNAGALEAPALAPVDTEALASPVSSFLPGAAAAAEPVSELTGQVSSKVNDIPGSGPVKSVLSNGVSGVTSKLTDSVGGLLKSAGGKNLGNVVSQVKGLTKTSTDLVSNVLPSDNPSEASGGQGGLDVSGLLLALKVGKVTVENIQYSMTNDGVEVQATVIADVQSEGVAAAVISVLGFQVELLLTMTITSTHDHTNNTVQLEVEQKTMEVTKVTITLVKTVTGALPLPVPVPVPLDSVVLMVLSVELSDNVKKSPCGALLFEIDSAKNVTGQKFHYTIAKTKIFEEGLLVDYCGKRVNNSDWIPGNSLPKHPKNASISLILAHKAVRKQVTVCAEPIHIKVRDIEVSIIKLSYSYPSEGKLQLIIEFQLRKDGEAYGIVLMAVQYAYLSRNENGKMVTDIKLMRTLSERITPPGITDEVTSLLPTMLEKSVSAITECLNKWNLPPGVSSNPVPSSKIVPKKTNDLQMGK